MRSGTGRNVIGHHQKPGQRRAHWLYWLAVSLRDLRPRGMAAGFGCLAGLLPGLDSGVAGPSVEQQPDGRRQAEKP